MWFVLDVICGNHFLRGEISATATESGLILEARMWEKQTIVQERARKTEPDKGAFSCMPFCQRTLVPLE